MLRAVTHRDVLSSHMRDKKNVFLFGAKERSETRNITPWDLIPPTGGMHSHVATWRRIPCTEQALTYSTRTLFFFEICFHALWGIRTYVALHFVTPTFDPIDTHTYQEIGWLLLQNIV